MRPAPRRRAGARGLVSSLFPGLLPGLLIGLLLGLPATLRAADAATAGADAPLADGSRLADLEGLARAGRHAELIARLEPLVEAEPERAEPRFLLGNAYAGLGRYDDAVDVYVALTRDFPGRPEPHNNLAVIFVEQGRLEEARTALLAAARLRPGYARAQDNLGDLYMLMAEEAYARAGTASAAQGTPTSSPAGPPMGTTRTEARAPAGTGPDGDAEPAAGADRRQPSPVFALAERRAVLAAVERWRASWSARDVDAYLDSYLPGFRPDAATTHEDWRRIRRERLMRPEWIEVTLDDLEVVEASGDRARVSFEQAYRASNYADRTRKTLRLERRDGRWLIAGERSD